jgi:uncharacterized membrane protein
MFSIKESINYGWQKMKEDMKFVLLTTLILGIILAISGMENIFGFIFAIVGIVVRIGYTKIYLQMNEGGKPKISDIFNQDALPWKKMFWKYVGVSILHGLVIMAGLILLVIPGIFWAVRFAFSPIILIDTNGGVIASMKESYAITRGSFWSLLGFWVVLIILNVIGFFLVGVGMLFSFPISTFAAIHVYRKLSAAKAAVGTPAPAPAPAPTIQ